MRLARALSRVAAALATRSIAWPQYESIHRLNSATVLSAARQDAFIMLAQDSGWFRLKLIMRCGDPRKSGPTTRYHANDPHCHRHASRGDQDGAIDPAAAGDPRFVGRRLLFGSASRDDQAGVRPLFDSTGRRSRGDA